MVAPAAGGALVVAFAAATAFVVVAFLLLIHRMGYLYGQFTDDDTQVSQAGRACRLLLTLSSRLNVAYETATHSSPHPESPQADRPEPVPGNEWCMS